MFNSTTLGRFPADTSAGRSSKSRRRMGWSRSGFDNDWSPPDCRLAERQKYCIFFPQSKVVILNRNRRYDKKADSLQRLCQPTSLLRGQCVHVHHREGHFCKRHALFLHISLLRLYHWRHPQLLQHCCCPGHGLGLRRHSSNQPCQSGFRTAIVSVMDFKIQM